MVGHEFTEWNRKEKKHFKEESWELRNACINIRVIYIHMQITGSGRSQGITVICLPASHPSNTRGKKAANVIFF